MKNNVNHHSLHNKLTLSLIFLLEKNHEIRHSIFNRKIPSHIIKHPYLIKKKKNYILNEKGKQMIHLLEKIIVDYIDHFHIYKYTNLTTTSFAYDCLSDFVFAKDWHQFLNSDWFDLREAVFKLKNINLIYLKFFDTILQHKGFHFQIVKKSKTKTSKKKLPFKNDLTLFHYIEKANLTNASVQKKINVFKEEKMILKNKDNIKKYLSYPLYLDECWRRFQSL